MRDLLLFFLMFFVVILDVSFFSRISFFTVPIFLSLPLMIMLALYFKKKQFAWVLIPVAIFSIFIKNSFFSIFVPFTLVYLFIVFFSKKPEQRNPSDNNLIAMEAIAIFSLIVLTMTMVNLRAFSGKYFLEILKNQMLFIGIEILSFLAINKLFCRFFRRMKLQ